MTPVEVESLPNLPSRHGTVRVRINFPDAGFLANFVAPSRQPRVGDGRLSVGFFLDDKQLIHAKP